MKKRTSTIALILVLTMVLSLFSCGTVFAAETDPFTLATELTEDDQFVIVIEHEGKTYAMDLVDEVLVPTEVTINGDIVEPVADTNIWWARADQLLENAGVEGTFVYASSHGLITYNSGRTFEYNDTTKHISMHNGVYWLAFDGKVFTESYDEADAVTCSIYRREMPKTEKEEKFVPDGSDLPAEIRDAKKNEDGSITLAFVSDIHYSTSYPQMNLKVWLENIQSEIGYIDAIGSCGDMGSAYAFVAPLYWSYVSAVFKYMDPIVESGKIGSAVYTFGNHEWISSMGGDFMNNYENAAAKRLMRVGEALRTDDYIFYCLGAGEIAAKQRMGYSDEDIARIEAYLATAPSDIPIFVLTHFPLHYLKDRLCENADKLIEVLNAHPNVVYIWGHNHSEFDAAYNSILHAGDKLVIDGNGTESEINFTYLAAGCISDEEYTGGAGGSAWVQGKGLIVTINPDGSLKYEYYTMDGEPMEEEGPYMVTFREGAYYSILERQLVEPGKAATAPELPEIPNYIFTGWDSEFDNITGHTVVTAQYEFQTELDPNYVYLTVQVGDTIAVGKDGEPVIQYAVPYSEQLTALDMMKQVEMAALGTDASEVAAGSWGVIKAFWGVEFPDNSKLLVPFSEEYVSTQDYVTPGCSYYVVVRGTEDPIINPSYLTPFNAEAKVGEAVKFYGEAWGFNAGNMMYPRESLNGDVLLGKSIDALVDTGIDAVDGKFSLTIDEAGTYYVAVKSEGNCLAVNRVVVSSRVSAFTDVKVGEWFYDYVTALANAGIIDGMGDGTFQPNGTLTWAQAMKLLICAYGELDDCTGSDWADVAIQQAAKLELCAKDQDGSASISRLAFCKAAAKLFGLSGTATAFPDCSDADVLALVAEGIISGYPDGTFRPENTLTRAEISRIIYQLTK